MIPDNMMPKQTVHAIHLRRPSKSGQEDWVGIVSHAPMIGGKLWIVNGQTKHVLAGGGAGRAVKAPGTERALSDAATKKLDAGYTLVDEYEARNGCWNSELSQSPQPTPTPLPQPDPPSTPPAAVKPAPILSDSDSDDREPTMCW